jgi:hypothetical protein
MSRSYKLYVAPNGNDFHTPESTIRFDERDSGRNGYHVIYRNAPNPG